MTCCLALAIPGISLVAADTRVGLTYDMGQVSYNDGPNDFHVSVADTALDLIIPFRFRKIRRLSNSWATSAGDYLTGKYMLDELERKEGNDFHSIQALFAVAFPRIKAKIKKNHGFSDLQINSTIIIGAPYERDPKVWSICFDINQPYTNAASGNFCINWPKKTPKEISSQAEAKFIDEIRCAAQTNCIAGIVRAAARVIATAASYAPDVSQYTQVGFTLTSGSGATTSHYLELVSLEMLSISDELLELRFEKLT